MFLSFLLPVSVAVGVVGYIGVLSSPGSSLFSYHPACMSLAFIGVLSSSILFLNRDVRLAWQTKTFMHWLLNGVAVVAAAVGFGSIYYNKEQHGKPHFVSWHGLTGACACALLLSQLTFGGAMNYSHYVPLSYKTLRRCHALSGTLVYTLGFTAFALGLFSSWFQAQATVNVMVMVGAAQAVVALSVSRQIFRGLSKPKTSQKKS